MVFNKKFKFLVLFLFLIIFISFSYAQPPSFTFSSSSFNSGNVDIIGQISSGINLELFVNNNYVGKQNIIAPVKIINLTNEIVDETIGIGQIIRFVNINLDKNFTLNITGFPIRIISYGENFDFYSFSDGSYAIKNDETGVIKNILVGNQITNFNFSSISQSYLLDGNNNIKFILHDSNNFNNILDRLNYSFTYNKYINTITFTNYTNVTNSNQIYIEGFVSDINSPLKYILNNNGAIANIGLLNNINVLSTRNFNISISNLIEGNNSIRFIMVDGNNPEIFTAEKILNILVDTKPPSLNIISASYDSKGLKSVEKRNADFTKNEIYLNGNTLNLNISTDSIKVDYTFNNINDSCGEVINNSILCQFKLKQGQNNLTLFGIDIAGNIVKEAHSIYLDNTPLVLIKNKLDPKVGTTAHFFLQDLKGAVNKPGVKISSFVMPLDSKYFFIDKRTGEQIEKYANCNDFNFLGKIRDIGYIDYSVTSPELDLLDKQISLLDLVRNKVTTTSDGNGNFKLRNIILKERNYDNYRFRSDNKRVSSVQTQNTICLVLTDKYGNIQVDSTTLELDSGNTLWVSGEITPTPSTIYAAEIEQINDFTSGNSYRSNPESSGGGYWGGYGSSSSSSIGTVSSGGGYTEVGIIARIHYSGSGVISNVRPIVDIDSFYNPDLARYARVVSNNMNYLFDKETNDMVLYFPVEILPMNRKPLDYPKKLKLGFQVQLTYDLEGNNKDNLIPIDTINPVYFQTSLNIERPLDMAKWLTPKMINKGINFLNKSIEFTKRAADFTGIAATIGVVACTGAKFYYGSKIKLEEIGNNDQAIINNLKEKLYKVCDRVVCSAAPDKCDINRNDYFTGSGILKINNKQNYYSGSDLSNNTQILSKNKNGEQLAKFDSLNIGGKCTFGQNSKGENISGRLITGDITKYGKTANIIGWQADTTSKFLITNQCAPYDSKSEKINLAAVSDSCYIPKEPRFDDARSLSHPGNNPKKNIIESIRGGCITDSYSHLKNYLQIQESIKGCLEQAKIGVTQGSYCERLMSQAVCDIATNVIFSEFGSSAGTGPQTRSNNPFDILVSGAQNGDKLLNDRYSKNQFFSQSGLGSTDVVNRVCLAAFTGDWNALTQNIVGALDKNQIEPTFGPMVPESRIQGYNPLTGDLSVRYMFTYAGISGGQRIDSKVELICDKSKKGGQYCPDQIINSVEGKSSFFPPRLSIPERNSRGDSIVLTDTKARFMYNVVRITHTYELNKERKTEVFEENIIRRDNGLLASCSWNGGTYGIGVLNDYVGIHCNKLFGPDSLVSVYKFGPNTRLAPKDNKVYYSGNDVYVNLDYDVRDKQNLQDSFDLGYKASCKSVNDKTNLVGFTSVKIDQSGILIGNKIVDLFKIPEIGIASSNKKTKYSFISKNEIKDLTNVKLIFTNTEWIKDSSIQIIGGDLGISIGSGLSVGQSLTISDGNKLKKEVEIIDINKFEKDTKYSIEIDGDTKNLKLSLEYTDKNGNIKIINLIGKILNIQSNDKFSNLVEGGCDLSLKILPPGKGNELTFDNFDTYSPAGKNAKDLTNINLGDSTKKLNFVVRKTPQNIKDMSSKDRWFELISPKEKTNLCFKPNSIMDVKYLFQSPDNKYLNVKADLAVSADRYKLDFGKKKEVNLKDGISNSISNFKTPTAKILGDNIDKNIDMTLDYTLKEKNSNNKVKILKTKRVKFRLKISDNCKK